MQCSLSKTSWTVHYQCLRKSVAVLIWLLTASLRIKSSLQKPVNNSQLKTETFSSASGEPTSRNRLCEPFERNTFVAFCYFFVIGEWKQRLSGEWPRATSTTIVLLDMNIWPAPLHSAPLVSARVWRGKLKMVERACLCWMHKLTSIQLLFASD